MPVVPATQEAEAGELPVSRDRAIALQPGEQERNSVSKKKKKERKKERKKKGRKAVVQREGHTDQTFLNLLAKL